MSCLPIYLSALALMFLLNQTVCADVALTWPALIAGGFMGLVWFMLIPFVAVVLIEAQVYRRLFPRSFKEALMPSFVANLISSLLGAPIRGLLLNALTGDTTGKTALHFWDYLLGFVLSVAIEYPIVSRFINGADSRSRWKLVAWANAFSYAFLIVWTFLAFKLWPS